MLSIVIVARDQVERLRLTLRSVVSAARHDRVGAEIIVVNDGASAIVSQAVERAAAAYGPMTEVRGARGGRSAARNAGASRARGERLVFLDGDVLASRGLLAAHIRRGAECPGCLVRGTIVHMPWLAAFQDPLTRTLTSAARRSLGLAAGDGAALQAHRLELDADGLPDRRVDTLARIRRFERDLHAWLQSRPIAATGRWIGCTGANLSVSRRDFERVGGFDERMGLRWGAEDLEFGYRAEKAGMPLVHATDAVVYHMDHGVSDDREADHRSSVEYFASKHRDASVLELQAYFFGTAMLSEVLAP